MKRYGLIGYPLKHSFSRRYFNEKFEAENIAAEYVNFEIPRIKDLNDVVSSNPNLCGLNVTIPYKEQVIPLLDELHPDAAAIGAVNVIEIAQQTDGRRKLIGHNSDVYGFTRSIEPLLKPHHTKALILGTGGASKAVRAGLTKLGLESVFVSRTPQQGQLGYADLNAGILGEYTVIVNCTPVGMFPNTEVGPDLPYHLLTSQHLLYDLIYNPDTTLFMKRGMEQGAQAANGLQMLLLQAIRAWEIWNR